MKKVLSLILGLGMLFSITACGNDENGKAKTFVSTDTAETYSVYSFEPESGATYKAYAPDGSEIAMLNGSFSVRGEGEYYYSKTLKGKTTYYKVIADDTTAPELRLSYTKRYAKLNEAIKLPAVEVIESDGTKEANVSVSFGGEAVTVTDGAITPAALGEYTVTVNSEDKSGNASSTTAIIVCTENEYELNTIYELSSVWGMENQTAHRMGVRMETTDVLAPNGEPAAKFNMTTPDYFSNGNSRKHETYLINPMQNHWGEKYSKVYFWVDNQTEFGYYVRFMGLQIYVAPNSGWTKIEFSDFEFLGGDGASYETIIDHEDYEGTYLCLQRGSKDFRFGTFYVSNIYGEPKPAVDNAGGQQ